MSNYTDHRSVLFNINNNKIENVGNRFICDGLIAQTISELRAKGYKTSECCAGHSNELLVERYEREITLKDKSVRDFIFENYLIGRHIQITNINGNKIKFNCIFNYAKTYILFSMNCAFSEDLPEGFDISNSYNGWTCIERHYQIMNNNGTYRSVQDVDKEIREANEQLLEWAKSLKHIKESGETKKR